MVQLSQSIDKDTSRTQKENIMVRVKSQIAIFGIDIAIDSWSSFLHHNLNFHWKKLLPPPIMKRISVVFVLYMWHAVLMGKKAKPQQPKPHKKGLASLCGMLSVTVIFRNSSTVVNWQNTFYNLIVKTSHISCVLASLVWKHLHLFLVYLTNTHKNKHTHQKNV